MLDNPVMVSREVVGLKTYLLLIGDTEEKVRAEAQRLLGMLAVAHHDPYGGTCVEFENNKFWTRIEYWTDKEVMSDD